MVFKLVYKEKIHSLHSLILKKFLMCKLRFVYGSGRGRVRMLAQIRFRGSAVPHNHKHKNALVINFKEGHFDKN